MSSGMSMPAECAAKMDAMEYSLKLKPGFKMSIPRETSHHCVDEASKIRIAMGIYRAMNRKPKEKRDPVTCPQCGAEAGYRVFTECCSMFLPCHLLARFHVLLACLVCWPDSGGKTPENEKGVRSRSPSRLWKTAGDVLVLVSFPGSGRWQSDLDILRGRSHRSQTPFVVA